MTQADTAESSRPGKGKVFFERAEEVAETGNWDFAIELYIEGIRREPDNIEQGHQPLREVSLKRKAQGGKGPGIGEKLKRRPSKDPVESLANACFLLAKEPGSISYMTQVLQAAGKLELSPLTKWICDILLESQRQAKKANIRLLKVITAAYQGIEDYISAIEALEMARAIMPNDGHIQEMLSDVSANYTLQKGKYGQEGDFTKSVMDLEGQKGLYKEDMLAQDREYLEGQIEKARNEYLVAPTIPGKINSVVDAVLKIEEEAFENEAVDILTKAHADTGAYQFKMRIGDVKIRQMTRRHRKLVEEGDKVAAAEHLKGQLAFELQEYAERAINYPTDLSLKFELGHRQYMAGRYDDAIGSLQQAQRDPRRHIAAMNYLGQAFEGKEWHREAAETYERALETEMSENRAKEVRYNLGNVLEKMGELERAQKEFSTVAQIDFNYKDVRERLERVNKAINGAAKSESK